ncbi:GspE/PulE family protein [Pseudomonas aeruginosa]|jgi:type II secretory ATPase GspE/PulE/Tfp pilus assembly ATPase PilB-like protein|uniref:GspE/PulE family protein n=1 Tax=Pseudomonas aeruginosa TaxID=287 RepID=UPI001A19178D|nr:GspE/PulE family protein [Pseudomonas aeruginosa]MBH8699611.1 type II/IV secretion system protein [Pseudomonas aeruginosa]WBM10724.1 GspE/PulE family protein [Pseudomonas aeruginosa]HCL4130905.1 type II/IV secretion system protein [Pseudomonas aeruginosa]HEK3610242.1 type II/IV secretion system protein [Pseudomonas aeruginosa]
MSSAVVHRQKRILDVLVRCGAITKAQADSMAPCESIDAVIHDIGRLANNEAAVVAAVGEAMRLQVFTGIDEGRECKLSDGDAQFVIYDGVMFTPNPLDQKVVSAANAFALRHGLASPKNIGVIGAQQLEALRNEGIDPDQAETADSEHQKEVAKKLVTELVRNAAARGATDVHLVPSQQTDQVQVRYRIDGRLRSVRQYKESLQESVTRVILDTFANKQYDGTQPQDANFNFEVSGSKTIELRVSTLPVSAKNGRSQKIVIRLLGNDQTLVSLPALGMTPENTELMNWFGSLPAGLVLVTGPTGSGKTTTLSATLDASYRNDPDRSFQTVQDPIEFRHEGMGHTEATEQLGFATVLRALLRQDPDVILVGEMRDDETAELAYNATMTGHLVFSTLHTSSSHQTIDRLMMMNVPRDIIATYTTAVVAQRLVAKLCPHCKKAHRLTDDAKRYVIYSGNAAFAGTTDPVIYKANPDGCDQCKTGFGGMKGRIGVVEILQITPDIQDAMLLGTPGRVLRRKGLANGTFRDMWDDGLRLVKEGITTLEELEKTLDPYLTDRTQSAESTTAAATQQTTQNQLLPQL